MKIFHTCHQKNRSDGDGLIGFTIEKESARYLLTKIEQFSKISGLEINRTKSECLLLDFELGIDKDEASLFGIPIVENLKILGHYFGKNKMICEYNNFYSKLKLIEKIIQTWKQRSLSLLGKNILVNSLVNSLILFNAQIEIPPSDFLNEVESKCKSFLWDGGVPKIAHQSLIGDYHQGGIRP